MSVRDVICGTLAVVMLVLLGVVGWQTAANKSDVGELTRNVKLISEGMQVLNEGFKGCATKQEFERIQAKFAVIQNGRRATDVAQTIPPPPTAPTSPRAANPSSDTTAITDGGSAPRDPQKNASAGKLPNIEKTVQGLVDRAFDQDKIVAGLVDRANEQSKDLGQVVMWVRDVGNVTTLRSQGDGAKPAPNVQRSGELKIINRMNSDQRVVINGRTLYTVLVNETLRVPVSAGTVTTKLLGSGEGPISWFIGPQNYTQDIIIAPALLP